MSNENPQRSDITIGGCLSSQEIKALVAGKLSPDALESTRQHLSCCERCRTAVENGGLDVLAFLSRGQSVGDTSVGNGASPQRTQQTTTSHPNPSSAQASSAILTYLSPPQEPDEIGRIGEYRVKRVLGEGGMGVVFEAEDPQLHRSVAIKVLRPEALDDSTRQRFLNEARVVASLRSERIVTIYQIGEENGRPFIVMERLHGDSLDRRIAREGRMDLAEALRITGEVAEGLAVAHNNGLIHRDIKPANIFLEKRDGDESAGHVKLLDFGIARSTKNPSRLTVEGSIIGTPSYMSPEQARGRPLDARSDLFSLGAVLYSMLDGQSPFERENTMLTLLAAAEADVSPLQESRPAIPSPVTDLLRRLLSKNPDDRPSTALEVVDQIRQLQSVLTNPTLLSASGPKPTPAPTPTPSPRQAATVTSKRKPGLGAWIGIATLILAAVNGLTVGYWRMTSPKMDSGTSGSQEQFVAPDQKADSSVVPIAPVAKPALPTIKVGILHSLTGPMATSERSIVDASIFAIDEINAAGGLLGGRQIEPVVRDGASYDSVFAEQALELIEQDKVVTLFGIWRSSCRKSVLDACDRFDFLLVYPAAYEGLEESPKVIYMGGSANQITPSIGWAYATRKKKKFFLVGTEGMYSRGAHEIIKDELRDLGASVVGEEFHPLDDTNFTETAQAIVAAQPDMIINSVIGVGNYNLFGSLQKAGVRPDKIPILSMHVTEEDLRMIASNGEQIAGNYSAWSYFQSLPNPKNQEFIQRFRKRFGPTRVVTDPMVAAYTGLHLWALAVTAAESDNVADVRKAIVEQQFDGPEGLVTIDAKTNNARRMSLIGEVNTDFEFDVVWTTPRPLDPEPYPPWRTRAQWDEFVQSVRARYGGHWRPKSNSSAAE